MHNQAPPQRLIALDIFRGLTVALMIIVNSPGNTVAYPWLEHSIWNGCRFADLLFPFFLVIVGVSTVLALSSPNKSQIELLKKIIKRSAFIFILGWLLNAFPKHLDLLNVRFFGVLQRIALCYFFAALLCLFTKPKTQAMIMAALLLAYWGLLNSLMLFQTGVDPLSIEHNLVGALDRLLLCAHHLYTPHFDPEGLLSTVPALASTLIGNLLGYCLISDRSKQQKQQWIICMGLALSVTGLLWSIVFPFNKPLWSSSYVLWTSGLAFLAFALCYTLIEIKQWLASTDAFVLFGRHALLVYVLHIVGLKIQSSILVPSGHEQLISLKHYITHTLFGELSNYNASAAYAVTYTLFWLFVLKLLVFCKPSV